MRRNVITVAVTLCALVMALTGCKELSRKALSSAGRSQLEVEVEKYNDELPEAVAEGLLVTEVAVSGDRVIYKCKMSEDMYDIDSMRDNLNGAKKGIMDSFRDGMDADLREFLQAIVDEDMELVYRYYGSSSGKRADVVISTDELSRLLRYY